MKLSRSDSYYNSPSRTDDGTSRGLLCSSAVAVRASSKISRAIILSGILLIFLLAFAVVPVYAEGEDNTFREEDIIPLLQRRRPGLSPLSTPRKEEDMPEILSGVFNGKTTGTPVAIIVRNTNQNSGDYEAIKDLCRPGHADYTYDARYGHENRDWRGGGRSSGRETVARVLGGSLAVKILAERGVTVRSRIVSIHGETAPEKFESEILAAKGNGDSVGGVTFQSRS